ncbi:CoA pyrophosphatase [Ramlibacter rhizophilus]|uniref:CoA pyrophosphatase n=1 Tax=Ramlibacter rhizophilus TaxID=1781167 RepID=A0A4Z0BZ94_9BURK|nr:CoA pyrophosphatase [Ramlibacter rhizophilus]TFZ04301.1 CoA pyrophosphatase [Ramlibacter rhizophilus]
MPIDPAPAPPPDFVPLTKLPHFDPRAVPVIGIDSHLPAVAPERLAPERLRERFRAPPSWTPELRAEPRFTDREVAQASVLVPVVMRGPTPTVILTERTTHLSTHSGQIAFPGGRRDDTDTDAAHTALREAHEEIGLADRHVEVIGHLPTYTTGTRFVVTPVIALVDPGHELTLNPHEVADAFEVPLAFLMNPAHHHRHAIEVGGQAREFFSMPYMQGRTERFIWGATAGMLRNLYRFLAA